MLATGKTDASGRAILNFLPEQACNTPSQPTEPTSSSKKTSPSKKTLSPKKKASLVRSPEKLMKVTLECEAGLWVMGVSLNHTSPEVVNQKRRTAIAFDAARSALEMSRRFGFYTFINAVADRQMVLDGEHERLYHLAKRLGIQELRLIEPMPCGRLTDEGHDALLQPEEVDTLRRFHREANVRGRGPKVCAFNEVESPELFGCSAGFQHLYIDPAGAVCPCDFTPLSFGNVQEEPLAEIWHRMNAAMRQPRCHCFIQAHAARIRQHREGHTTSPCHRK